MIVTPPQDKTLSIEEPDVDINVSGDKISAVLKAAAILQLKEVAISCDGSQVYIEGLDTNQSDSYKEIIQDWTPESTFKFIFKTESFKMLPGDYNIKINKGGIAQFSSKRGDVLVTYWVAAESSSNYNG